MPLLIFEYEYMIGISLVYDYIPRYRVVPMFFFVCFFFKKNKKNIQKKHRVWKKTVFFHFELQKFCRFLAIFSWNLALFSGFFLWTFISTEIDYKWPVVIVTNKNLDDFCPKRSFFHVFSKKFVVFFKNFNRRYLFMGFRI